MAENTLPILADAVVNPIDVLVDSGGIFLVIAAVIAVVAGAILFLKKKKK